MQIGDRETTESTEIVPAIPDPIPAFAGGLPIDLREQMSNAVKAWNHPNISGDALICSPAATARRRTGGVTCSSATRLALGGLSVGFRRISTGCRDTLARFIGERS